MVVNASKKKDPEKKAPDLKRVNKSKSKKSPQDLLEIVDDSPVPVVNVGDRLRQRRLEQGKKVSDISLKLCISERYIQGLEDMDLEQLPERTYALGFLRSYAQHLGFDSTEIINTFKKELFSAPKNQESLSMPTPVMSTEKPKLKYIIAGGIIAIVLSLLASFLFNNDPLGSHHFFQPFSESQLGNDKNVPGSDLPQSNADEIEIGSDADLTLENM